MGLWSILRYYAPQARAYAGSIAIVLVLYGMAVLLRDVGAPLLYKMLFDIITAEEVVRADVINSLSMVLIGIAAIVIFANIFFRLADYLHPYVQSRIMKRLYDEAYRRVEGQSYAFFADAFVGSLVAKIKRYVDSFETIQDTITFQFWNRGITVISSLAVLWYFSPTLGLLFVGWLVVFAIGSYFFVRAIIARDLAYASEKSVVTGVLADALTNTLNVKMFARSAYEKEVFANATAKEERLRRRAWFMHIHQTVFQGTSIAIVEVVSIFIAIKLWLAGAITVGTIVLMQTYLFVLFTVVWDIGRNITRFLNALADAQEMIEIFEKPIHVQDQKQTETVRITSGAVAFNNVSFAYNSKKPVFKDLSLSIPAGQRVGLVGHSGAGKTTITKLLLRFTDIQEGVITIDGQNIAAITQDDLRRHISYVPQEPILFHRTLLENIAYGKPDATKEEIITAAKRAHAHEFIETLSEGYETLVGERGIKLSGGERQRVAIARAMLKDAPVLILDEATSSLDSLSERYIQEGFDELMKGRTTLVIAHRLSTIVHMDRILVFESGTVVEDGTHEELLKKDGVYATLWKEQSGGFIGE